jgi:TrpR-related protein YerC/YecD
MIFREKQSARVERLFDTIHLIENKDALANFLLDLFTPKELEEFANRLQIAGLLDNGLTQREISRKTGASVSTVSRVSTIMQYGRRGYEGALKLIKK